jgi:hypothetical protein
MVVSLMRQSFLLLLLLSPGNNPEAISVRGMSAQRFCAD